MTWWLRASYAALSVGILVVLDSVRDYLPSWLDWVFWLLGYAAVLFFFGCFVPSKWMDPPTGRVPGETSVVLSDVGDRPIKVLRIVRSWNADVSAVDELHQEVAGSAGFLLVQGVSAGEAKRCVKSLTKSGARAHVEEPAEISKSLKKRMKTKGYK